MTKIGTVFDQTSTSEFLVMLDNQRSNEQLLFSYVELRPNGDERIVARITNVFKENPLLSRDQAGVSASIDLQQLGMDFSTRFTYGWATCSVVGALRGNRLDMNRRGVSPNDSVYVPEESTLRALFYSPLPSHIPVGEIETVGADTMNSVPITLNADQMVTKHFCIFGMTGSGKTNSAAKILEELMARGHRIIVFDSHDDYLNLENLTNLFRDVDPEGTANSLECTADNFVESVNTIVSAILEGPASDNPFVDDEPRLRAWVIGRLLQTTSVIHQNKPARDILRGGCREVTSELVRQIMNTDLWRELTTHRRVASYRVFPELRDYGDGYEDFTIHLMEAMQGERFTPAQWRWLRDNIGQNDIGVDYLRNLYRATQTEPTRVTNDSTRSVLQQKLNGLQAIYRATETTGAEPFDLEEFFDHVATHGSAVSESVHRLSMSDLSSNMRKALLYGITTFFFRRFKFGGYRARRTESGDANAHSVMFMLEEARSLIPRSSGIQDDDAAGGLARSSLRELAYEGRKFSLGFGIVSQKPASVDQEVVSQANTFILHQLKSPDDQQYVRTVTESMSAEELDMIKGLGTGRAIVAGVAVKSPVLIRMHYRYSEEGIPEPTPMNDQLAQSTSLIRQELGIEPRQDANPDANEQDEEE